jgi:hypothetical protein
MTRIVVRSYAILQLLVVLYVYLVGTPRANRSNDGRENGFIFCRSLDTLKTPEILVIVALMACSGVYTVYRVLPAFSLLPYFLAVAFPLAFILQWKSLNYSWHSHIVATVFALNFALLYFLLERHQFTAVATVYVLLFAVALAILIYRAERLKQGEKWALELEFSYILLACAVVCPLSLLFFPAEERRR